MTATSDAIRSLRFSARYLTPAEVDQQILEPLRRDAQRSATVADLLSDGTAQAMIRGMYGESALAFVQLLAGACDETGAQALRRTLRESKPQFSWLFDVSYDLHNAYRRMGATTLASPRSTVMPVVPTSPTAPFSGVGATNVSPRAVRVPLGDQFEMLMGDQATRSRYGNPLGDLEAYLQGLTAEQRRRQGELLTQLPITSGVPHSYVRLPSRMAVFELAARTYNLHAELLAAFVLAEQRDQSQLEDGKDYAAATSLARANTSIGLGKVVISTAQRGDLFSDLLSPSLRANLGHTQVAFLLASDEFNIFAAAKYIRQTADAGATISAASLPYTFDVFRGLDPSAYRLNSRHWSAANIMALGSEYTSAPWDDRLSGWGWFVYEAYLDLMPAAASATGGATRGELRERYRTYRRERADPRARAGTP